MEPILEMEGASAGRGTTFCLRDVCLAVEPGMLMGVIGRNGAGKTTLFHMVCGLCRVSSGSVRIDGVSVRHEPERCKKEIGVVFDDDFFRLDLTVKAAGEIYGMYYERYSKQDFLGYCRQFEVDVRQNIRKLSKGNYMKFQLAFALAHHPKLLLLDEPDAGLDPVFRKEWMGILYDVREEGCGVLYATHLTEGLEQYADAVTMLSRGRQVFSLTMPEL